jgi:putative hydrolase of the HAD superfamily
MIERADAVIFDFYNTLALGDQLPTLSSAILSAQGFKCNEHLISLFEPNAFDGTTMPTLECRPDHASWMKSNLSTLLKVVGVPPTCIRSLVQELYDHQARFTMKRARGSRSLIGLFHTSGLKVGLCSNWEYDITEHLNSVGLSSEAFDAVVSSASVGFRKPHPRIFLEVANRLSVAPERCIFVGDDWTADVGGSLRAGMSPVWIRHKRRSKQLGDLIPEFRTLESFRRQVTAVLAGK